MGDLSFLILLTTFWIIAVSILTYFMASDFWSLLVTGLLIGVFIINYKFSKIEKVKTKTYTIISIAGDQQKINGSFFLGTGIIKSKEYYLANVQKRNEIERLYIPVENTIRIIDNNLIDKAIYKEYYCIRKGLFTKSDIDNCYNFLNSKFKNVLLIPKNSIIKQINFQ